jgi:hypothetical protein
MVERDGELLEPTCRAHVPRINWTINPAARSAIALAVGLAGGLVVAVASWASKRTSTYASPQAAR